MWIWAWLEVEPGTEAQVDFGQGAWVLVNGRRKRDRPRRTSSVAWRTVFATSVGLGPLFRIGQSMHHVLISTLDHHRLTSEPRVTLDFHPKEQTVRVAYSCSNLWFNEPISQETIPISTAMPSILGYLRRLWIETKPATPIPDGLSAT